MKRFATPSIIAVGRSVIAGPPKSPPRGGAAGEGKMPTRANDRGYINTVEKHRAWRAEEDKLIEDEFQRKFNSNPKIPATHKYNLNVNENGYGMRRRLRVQKGEHDPKKLQSLLDGSQLAMNFK